MENNGFLFSLEHEFIDGEFVFESRGVNDNYACIINEIINECKNINPILVDTDLYLYRINNYHVKSEESFIGSLNAMIYVVKGGNSGEFSLPIDLPHFLENGKLINVDFKIFVDGKNEVFNEPLLRELLSHEIHHAYRHQQMVLKNNGKIPHSEVERQNGHNWVITLMNDSKNVIAYLLYKLDNDEIMAMCAESYQKLKSLKANRQNYKSLISSLEPMELIDRIETVLSYLSELKDNDEIIDNFGLLYNGFLKANGKKEVSNDKAFKMLKQYLLFKKTVMYNQFYKVLGKALMEFDMENNVVRSYPNVTNERWKREFDILIENISLKL